MHEVPLEKTKSVDIELGWGLFFVFGLERDRWLGEAQPGIEPLEEDGYLELLVNISQVLPGGDGLGTSDAWEIDYGLRVVPQVWTRDQDRPPSATWVRGIQSADEPYMEACRGGHYPVFEPEGLWIQHDSEALMAQARDDNGPILELALRDPGRDFRPFARRGQEVVVAEREVLRYDYWLEGTALILEGDLASPWGRLHEHPFFGELDLSGPPLPCRERMALEPGRPCGISYLTPTAEEEA